MTQTQTQAQPAYYGSASTIYSQKLPANYQITNNGNIASASVPQAYISSVPVNSNSQQLSNQHIQQQASNSNGAIHYGTHLYQSALAKYGYGQLNAVQQKYY